jgi:[methyl-Co(III) methanol-specific corrinoid protein]:coenzyme M methyltransferase
LKALRRARTLRPDLALVGNLVGPFSLLGMLADPLQVLRWTRRKQQALHDYLHTLCEGLFEFGKLQKEAGADVICIAEPTATGEILGGPLFRAFALSPLNSLSEKLRGLGLGIILHICGDVSAIEDELFALSVDAVSFDSMVDIVSIARKAPRWLVMGNMDAFLLRKGPPNSIRKVCWRLLNGGVRLLAPACGVIPTTPVSHLKAMRASADLHT